MDPMVYRHGQKYDCQMIPRGPFGKFHGCKYVIYNQINKGTSWLLQEQETNLLQSHHVNLSDICPFLHMP
jgi:hypothetical protein